MWVVAAIRGHVDGFCQEVAGKDSWIDSHNFEWGYSQPFSVEVEFRSRLNCVCCSRSQHLTLNSDVTHSMQKYIQNDYPFCGGYNDCF